MEKCVWLQSLVCQCSRQTSDDFCCIIPHVMDMVALVCMQYEVLVIYIIFFLDYKINLDSGYAFKFLIVPLLSIKKDRLDINEYIDNYNDFSYGCLWPKLIIKNKYAVPLANLVFIYEKII